MTDPLRVWFVVSIVVVVLALVLLAAAAAGGAAVLALLPADVALEWAIALAAGVAAAPLLTAMWVRWRLRRRRAASPIAWITGFVLAAVAPGVTLTVGERSPSDLLAAAKTLYEDDAPPPAAGPAPPPPGAPAPPPAARPPQLEPEPKRDRFMAGTIPPHVRAVMRPRGTLRRMTPAHRARFAEARRTLENDSFLRDFDAPEIPSPPPRPAEALTDDDCPDGAKLYVFENEKQQITTYSCRLPDLATRRHRCAPHGPTLARMVRGGEAVLLDLRQWREGYEHGPEVVWRGDRLVARRWERGQVTTERRYHGSFRTVITHDVDDGPVSSVQLDEHGDIGLAGRIDSIDGGFVLETLASKQLRSARLCLPLFAPGSEHLSPGLHRSGPCLLAYSSRERSGRWRTEVEVYEREKRRRCIVESDDPSRVGKCEPDLDLGGQDEVPAVAQRPVGARALDHVDRPLQAHRLRSLAKGIMPIDPGGAAELYEAAIANDTRYDTAEVWLQLGEARRKWGDFPGAEQALREAWRKKPDWDIVVEWLPLLRLQGDEDRRSELYALARKIRQHTAPAKAKAIAKREGFDAFLSAPPPGWNADRDPCAP